MHDLPSHIVSIAAEQLGSAVVDATPLAGGYTPQRVLRLTLADGRTAVLKGAPPQIEGTPGPVWGDVLKKEIEAYHLLRVLRRWMPEWRGDFEEDGWRVLLLEDLTDAHRVPPWGKRTTERVADGLIDMHNETLYEYAPPAELHFTPPPFFRSIAERGATLGDLPPEYDTLRWWQWLSLVTSAGQQALDSLPAAAPRCIVHFDVRSDNLFLRNKRLVLIDWAHPAWETPAIDTVYWALGVELETGLDAQTIHDRYFRSYPAYDNEAIRYALAFCLGTFINSSQRGGAPTRLVETRRRFIVASAKWFASACGIPRMPGAED